MCVCVCVCVCISSHFVVDTYFIRQYRHFLCKYFPIAPFKMPYAFYDIQQEMVNKPYINNMFPSIFYPMLVLNQGLINLYVITNFCYL